MRLSSTLPLSFKGDHGIARFKGLALAVLIVALFAAAPSLPSFYITLINNIGLAVLVLVGLVLLTGIAGMTSFGQAAFVGLGAYTTAWLATSTLPVPAAIGQWPGLVLLAVLAVTLVVALGVGAITLRLSNHYLPLGTIAWGLSLYYLFGTFEQLGGRTGLSGLPPLSFGPWVLDRGETLIYPIWGAVVVALWLARNLLDSRFGRAMRSLNGGQIMAASMGVDIYRTKLAVFLIAAGLAGISGWLYAYTQRFVSPAPFGLHAGIDYIFMAFIGGVGQLGGAVVGAAVFVFSRDLLQDWLPRLLGSRGDFESIAFGLLIIALMQYSPVGLVGWFKQWQGVARRPRGQPSRASPRPSLPQRDLPPRGSEILRVDRLTRRYGAMVANKDISFFINAGEILAVIGPNGAGKSTLFNQLSCCDDPSEGDIRFRNESILHWPATAVARKGMGRTFQHVKLLPEMSVLDNVALGAHGRLKIGLLRSALRLDRADEAQLLAEARWQLERVGLGAHADAPAGTLALGQQRLLEIARALAGNPSLLLLDEPAAGLRLQEKQALAALLKQLRDDGVAILLVEHDMDFVMTLVDRVIVLVFGEMLVEGTPAQVQSDPRVIDAYLGVSL